MWRDGLRTQRLDRPYVRKDGRLRARELGRGAGAGRREAEGGEAGAHRRHRRRSRRRRGDVRAEGPARPPRLDATSTAARTAPSSIRGSAARATCSTPPSPASSGPTRSCSSAPTRGSRRRCSTRASASAGARAACQVGADRRAGRPHLPLRVSRRRPADAEGRRRGQALLRRRRCARRKNPMVIVGRRRGRARRWRGRAGAAARIALRRRPGQGRRLERLQRAAHGGLARRRPRPRLRAAARAASTRRHAGRGGKGSSTCSTCSAPTRSTWPRLGKAFVVYQGSHGDARRAARRRDPAGRRLHREERDLRQHRGPRADDRARRVPAGRGEGGLGDPARAVGRTSASTLPYDTLSALRAAMYKAAPAAGAPRRGRAGGRGRASRRWPSARRRDRHGAVRARRSRDFYLTNPIARASAVMAELSALKKTERSQRPRRRARNAWLAT